MKWRWARMWRVGQSWAWKQRGRARCLWVRGLALGLFPTSLCGGVAPLTLIQLTVAQQLVATGSTCSKCSSTGSACTLARGSWGSPGCFAWQAQRSALCRAFDRRSVYRRDRMRGRSCAGLVPSGPALRPNARGIGGRNPLELLFFHRLSVAHAREGNSHPPRVKPPITPLSSHYVSSQQVCQLRPF